MTVAPTSITDALEQIVPWAWQAALALPDAVQTRAQRLWTDTVSCAWSGLQDPTCRNWLALQSHSEPGTVPVPGSSARLTAPAAAAALAMGACWDEACEGSALAHGRPGVPIVAALWSQLGLAKPSWQALWRATAVGYEVGARLGGRLRIRPGHHVDGMWSAFGAAAAVCHLHGLDSQSALGALEVCAVQLPYSLYQPVAQGANVRNMYLGHSTWLALQSVQAVRAGLTAPSGAIDTFARLALDSGDAATIEPPGRWWLLDSYWKPFAGVRHVHYGAQAAIDLRAQLPSLSTITALRADVYPEALVYCGNRDPQTVIGAQFSLSFGIAAALVFGDLSPAQYRPGPFHDPQLRRLEQLLEIRPDPQAFPGTRRGARLQALVDGRWLQATCDEVLGDPGCEPDATALADKFARYTQCDPAMSAWLQALQENPASGAARWPDSAVRTPIGNGE